MTNALIALAAVVVTLLIAVIALRRLWRAFIRATDREIEKSGNDLRRRGWLPDGEQR